MSIEPNTALIIIGAGFFLLGVTGKILIEKFSVSLASLSSRIVISVFGLMLLFLGIVGPRNVMSSQKSKLPEIAKAPIEGHETKITVLTESNVQEGDIIITQPHNRDSVPGEIEVSGTYSEEIKGDIWLIVWPEKARGKGWPQSDDAESGAPALKKNGRWSVYCYFGGPPQRYEIVVYTSTHSASLFLGSKLREWYKNNDYKGISAVNLPNGLFERQRILVVKQR